MYVFQTNSPIKKVGHNEYIIGNNKTDPLALIKGKELIIDKVSAQNIDAITAKLSEDISRINEFLPNLEETPDFVSLSEKVETISGFISNIDLELDIELPDFDLLSGKIEEIKQSLPLLEETPDIENLSGKINFISGLLSDLEETPFIESISGKINEISGFLSSLEESEEINSLSGRIELIKQELTNQDGILLSKINSTSGLLNNLIHELDLDPFGGSLSNALGINTTGVNATGQKIPQIEIDILSGKIDLISGFLQNIEFEVELEAPDLEVISGRVDLISGLLADLEETPDFEILSGKINSISGSLTGLEESREIEVLSGKIDHLSGLLDSSENSQTSGNFEFLNITGSLIVNGIDIYPTVSGLLDNEGDLSVKIEELESSINDLKPDGGTYSFSTSLDNSSDTYFIKFPSLFSLPPKLNVSIETTGESVLVDHIISGVSNSGYHLIFADELQENTYVAHTMFDSNGEFAGEEAFEINSDGDIIPSNSPLISDTMWILRNQTDLEVRNNIWRYNTGPEAFTDEISF